MQIQMFAAFFIACNDGIGRVDRSTLPQQTLMELFLFGLNEPEEICRSRDDPADVCEWEGVNCNADGEVEEFQWVSKKQDGTGTLSFEFLPCSIKSLQMWRNALSGTIQFADLPGKIEVVYLSVNQLTGSLDLDRLPAAVRELDLSYNKFTGEVSLENLPKCLEFLSLAENQLSDTICLTSLPPDVECVNLGKNNFEGSLDFTRLPESMRAMYLYKNRFSGTIDLGNLPQSMRVLDVEKNAISGPWHVSGGGVSPEHIHHHRDKTLALVASMICIGTCSGNSRSPRIKFARHMFNTRSVERYGCRMAFTYGLMEMTNLLWSALNKKLN